MPLNEILKWVTDLTEGCDEHNKETLKEVDKVIAGVKGSEVKGGKGDGKEA